MTKNQLDLKVKEWMEGLGYQAYPIEHVANNAVVYNAPGLSEHFEIFGIPDSAARHLYRDREKAILKARIKEANSAYETLVSCSYHPDSETLAIFNDVSRELEEQLEELERLK